MAGTRSTARRSLVKRLFGPKNRHRVPQGPPMSTRVAGVLRWVLPAVVPVLMLGLGWQWVRTTMRHHSYFTVREVVAPSHGRIPADVLRATAGIELDASIWDVDTDAVAARLQALPWVRRARVRRSFPGRVFLDVREYRPVAILRIEDPKTAALYYVARGGRPFALVDRSETQDLPYISGLVASDLEGTAYGARSVRAALTVLRKTRHRVGLLGELSEIQVDRVRGLTLMPVRPAVPIELGWDGYDTKLARLRYVLAQWVGRERQMVAVSCAWDDDVIVRVATAAPPEISVSKPTPTPDRSPKRAPVPAKKPHRSTGA